MRNLFWLFLIFLWLSLATFGLALWWILHPEAVFAISNPVWTWLVGVYKPVDAEDKTNLAFYVSVFFVYLVTFIVLYRFRWMFGKKPK